ncbi:MAG TPA: hypothetical protein VG187_01280 [Mycobacterium sp.]|nr:hypothetical protein [Mycobacterium sp.]
MATSIGYYVGRHVGPTRSTWKKRTSRIALGRLAISLLVFLTARRIRQSFRAAPIFADAVHRWAPRLIAPLELLRVSVARVRT